MVEPELRRRKQSMRVSFMPQAQHLKYELKLITVSDMKSVVLKA